MDQTKPGPRSSAYVTLLRHDCWRELRDQLEVIPEMHRIALVDGADAASSSAASERKLCPVQTALMGRAQRLARGLERERAL